VYGVVWSVGATCRANDSSLVACVVCGFGKMTFGVSTGAGYDE